MAEVHHLRVVKNETNELLSEFDKEIKFLRDWLAEHGEGGFVLMGYSKNKQAIASCVNWHLQDAMDAYVLPDMLKARAINLRDKD